MKRSVPTLRNGWLAALTLAIVLWQIILLMSVRILPMVDTPFHLLAGTVIREWADTSLSIREYYALPQVGPNLFHLWFISRSVFPSVETANLLYYAAAMLLLPIAASMVIYRLGGVWQLGGLAALFTYHFSFVWGFAGYTLAVPLSLICLTLIIDVQQHLRKRDALMLAGLLALLFLTHGQMAMFMLLVLGFLVFYLFVTRTRGALLLVLSALPLALAVLVWSANAEAVSGVSLSAYLRDYYLNDFLASVPRRLVLPLYDLLQLNQGKARSYAIALSIAAPVAAVVLRSALSAASRAAWKLPPARFVAPLVYFTGAITAWLTLPSAIPSQAFVFERFSILTVLGALILAAGVAGPRILESRVFASMCVVSAATFAISSGWFYADWRVVSAPLRPSLFPAERDVRVGAVVCDPMFRNLPLFLHVASYQTVWHKGISATPVIDYRFGSLRRVASEEKLPRALDWLCFDRPYNAQFDRLEYLLLQESAAKRLGRPVTGTLIRRDGAWSLYRQASTSVPKRSRHIR